MFSFLLVSNKTKKDFYPIDEKDRLQPNELKTIFPIIQRIIQESPDLKECKLTIVLTKEKPALTVIHPPKKDALLHKIASLCEKSLLKKTSIAIKKKRSTLYHPAFRFEVENGLLWVSYTQIGAHNSFTNALKKLQQSNS